jgi:hypothetical protein
MLMWPLCLYRQYDAEYLEYGPSGKPWPFKSGIVKRVNYAFGGDPFTFRCATNEYPVVESAQRKFWYCNQELSALIRYPCQLGDKAWGGCTLDYNQT